MFERASYDSDESMDYFIKSSGTADSYEYTDEYAMVSSNLVMCPVLYYEGTVTKTHAEAGQAI